jgi:hypothetical protein
MKAFWFGRGFLPRASLAELTLGWLVASGILQLFESLERDIVFPVLRTIGLMPDMNGLRPLGIPIGPLLETAIKLVLKIAIFYFVVFYARSDAKETKK